jgi:hypothetical protein
MALPEGQNRMIYCYGLIDKYEAALDNGEFFKRGYTNPFRTGGDVFQTYEDAWNVLVERGSTDVRRVYGVLADWETDTIPIPGRTWRHLKQRAQVVRIPVPAI